MKNSHNIIDVCLVFSESLLTTFRNAEGGKRDNRQTDAIVFQELSDQLTAGSSYFSISSTSFSASFPYFSSLPFLPPQRLLRRQCMTTLPSLSSVAICCCLRVGRSYNQMNGTLKKRIAICLERYATSGPKYYAGEYWNCCGRAIRVISATMHLSAYPDSGYQFYPLLLIIYLFITERDYYCLQSSQRQTHAGLFNLFFSSHIQPR